MRMRKVRTGRVKEKEKGGAKEIFSRREEGGGKLVIACKRPD